MTRTKTARTLQEISFNQNEALLMAIKNHLDDAAQELKASAQDDIIAILNIAIQADNEDFDDSCTDEINAFIIDNVCDAHKCPYCGNWFFGDDDSDAGGLQWDEENECFIYCTATQNH